jgi:Fe2+ or Zn2+ uptake regulation protein
MILILNHGTIDLMHTDMATKVESRLAAHGVRSTRTRRRVTECLHNADGPLTAAEIHDLIADEVPLSSLYRTLAVLSECEVLTRFHDTAGTARFELAEWLSGHHHHLICVECGETIDLDLPPELEETINELAGQATADLGFTVSGHRLDVEGLCRRCR